MPMPVTAATDTVRVSRIIRVERTERPSLASNKTDEVQGGVSAMNELRGRSAPKPNERRAVSSQQSAVCCALRSSGGRGGSRGPSSASNSNSNQCALMRTARHSLLGRGIRSISNGDVRTCWLSKAGDSAKKLNLLYSYVSLRVRVCAITNYELSLSQQKKLRNSEQSWQMAPRMIAEIRKHTPMSYCWNHVIELRGNYTVPEIEHVNREIFK